MTVGLSDTFFSRTSRGEPPLPILQKRSGRLSICVKSHIERAVCVNIYIYEIWNQADPASMPPDDFGDVRFRKVEFFASQQKHFKFRGVRSGDFKL